MMYAIKYEDKYLRVGGGDRGRLMDRPEEATLYLASQLATAEKHKDKTLWVGGGSVQGQFKIVELEFTFVEIEAGERIGRAGWHNKPREK